MKKLGLVALTISLIGSTAGAIPLWDVNFSDPVYEVGQPPPTKSATAGAVNTQPTGVSVANVYSSILVQESFTAGGTVMGGQPLVMSFKGAGSTGGSISMTFQGALADYQSPAGFELSFDFMLRADETVDGPLGTGNFLELRMQNTASSPNPRYLGRVIFLADGSISYYNDFGIENFQFANAYSLDTLHHFRGVMDDTGTAFSIYIDNNYVGTVSWSYAEGEENWEGVRTVTFRNGTTSVNSAWSAGINNFKMGYAHIPEASHAALLIGVLALVGAFIRQRRSR